jgi:hypothetical protein
MPEGPAGFSLGQIALSAASGTVLSFLVAWLYRRWAKPAALEASQLVIVALLAGLSILVWRLAGNTQPLNDDPVPLVSPNDVLCTVLTYVILGLYADVSRAVRQPGWGSPAGAPDDHLADREHRHDLDYRGPPNGDFRAPLDPGRLAWRPALAGARMCANGSIAESLLPKVHVGRPGQPRSVLVTVPLAGWRWIADDL